ncbi:sec23/sec24 transport family protein, partial [Striga asiatica]
MDRYRMLSRSHAFNCVLRIRTSSEFKLGHSYGHFFPDPEYENVQHIICCDSFATYAYDFDFVNDAGFSRHSRERPTLQIAFQYSVVVPSDGPSLQGSGSSKRAKYSLKRRLRIRTVQLDTAHHISEIYDSVDPEVVLSILVHEVILSSMENGVREGRILLHEWLVNLTAQYNDAFKIAEYARGNLTTSQVDVAFTQCPQLQSLPRLVFALLRNPLLRFHEEGVHPDYRIYLQCLFSALEPSSLTLAIYPLLVSYETPDKQAFPRHSLSRAALLTSGSPIFFLDAFTTLVVFYSSTADSALPFPPPQDWQDDATVFENYLIEEQDVEGSGVTSVMGFVSFLDEINRDVVEYMSKLNGDIRDTPFETAFCRVGNAVWVRMRVQIAGYFAGSVLLLTILDATLALDKMG